MTQPEILKPLKTWSHLAGQRRKPSEYEIVTTNLHYTTNNPDAPFELDPNFPMAQWFKQYRNASPLTHDDWNAFRDPDEIVYRTYNMMQDGQETYVNGLLDQMSERGHDTMLERTWAGSLARLYAPSRYLFHTLQMASAYLSQMAPASTISNCATYQTADSLRWLTHTAYRTKELSLTFGDIGLGKDERRYWEQDAAWQGVGISAMHPGWARTPGVEKSLPGFGRLLGARLRDARMGADTLVWLASAPEVAGHSGHFWLDRKVRPTEVFPGTHLSDSDQSLLISVLKGLAPTKQNPSKEVLQTPGEAGYGVRP